VAFRLCRVATTQAWKSFLYRQNERVGEFMSRLWNSPETPGLGTKNRVNAFAKSVWWFNCESNSIEI
jgi:hypothetical protein